MTPEGVRSVVHSRAAKCGVHPIAQYNLPQLSMLRPYLTSSSRHDLTAHLCDNNYAEVRYALLILFKPGMPCELPILCSPLLGNLPKRIV
jgi:hypothetical protein